MASSRGRRKGKAAVESSRSAASSRTTLGDGVPDVYQSMLAEAAKDESAHSDRPLKRRRVANNDELRARQTPSQDATPQPDESRSNGQHHPRTKQHLQTVEASSDDSDSDLEFEDVELQDPAQHGDHTAESIEDLSISVPPQVEETQRVQHRRRPATVVEKAHRLQVHRLHILCLLGHCMYVNGRCNNAAVQQHLRPLLSQKTVSYLNPRADDTQFQRNRSFMDGLQQALDSFTSEFRVNGGGIRRPKWEAEGDANGKHESVGPMDRSDFISAAKTLEGSQDVANQLFCALLRSVDVDARVVCSLQVLPFANIAKGSTPQKPIKEVVFAKTPERTPSRGASSAEDSAVKTSSSIGRVPAVRRRLGQPAFTADEGQTTPPARKAKHAPKLSYPVFWVEAFNHAQQKWISIDPIVTHTINKPGKLEPPSSYELNQMSYVVAFEDSGVARDVTRRYTKAYNAKTRRHRVESSVEGVKWFKKAMRIFRRRNGHLDREQLEDAELAQKEAKEGMPANVLDFKDHPYYALERHMKRHEVIHPKREVGKVNAGTAAKPKMEPVYRRQDVHSCKSADKWYRVGREIKQFEQPLKQVSSRKRRQRSVNLDSEGDDPTDTVGLYAPHQTQQYMPPPVQRGRIPKNAFGNLDIYVPSMVPSGGIHVRHKLAQQAAKLLRIDYADAVTGFKFQGRHGTAIVEGAVVAEQYADAVSAVIDGFADQIIEDESKARSLEALRLWKRFLTGLRIAERVSQYRDGSDVREAIDQEMQEDAAPEAGGFVLADVEGDAVMPTAGKFSLLELATPARNRKISKRKHESSEEEFMENDVDDEPETYSDNEGGFVPYETPNEAELEEEFVADNDIGVGFIAVNNDEYGGGFVLHDEENSGGFLPDENAENVNVHTADQAGGFLPDNDDDGNASMAEQVEDLFGETSDVPYDLSTRQDSEARVPANDVSTTIQEPTAVATTTGGCHDDHHKYVVQDLQPEVTARDQRTNDSGNFEERDSDRASILSHDPDDDDAEPDWLESD